MIFHEHTWFAEQARPSFHPKMKADFHLLHDASTEHVHAIVGNASTDVSTAFP